MIRTGTRVAPRPILLLALLVPALLVGVLTTVGPLEADPVALWGGVGIGHHPGLLPGFVTIDPNYGTTSYALGFRAAMDLFSGTLPLWNHYEGFGAPLLGEMQSAALFPPTWLIPLPHGQAIEQSLLQAVAGLGTFLFLRRFGLGTTAALAGGLLFEFNGVFAWLRNAVYNPVAFLPWLFYAIETLFRLERLDGAGRWPPICLGAVAAALSLYAGFPEIVYLYALLLVAWAMLRACALPWRRACAFGVDLLAVAVLALLITAPLLIAFGHFLHEALVGGHHEDQFLGHYLPPQAFLVALLPYAFGPISELPQSAIGPVWGDIGGYIGIAPLLLAAAGLVASWRAATSRLLAFWVVLAVGASHGVPVLHGALNALPLVTIAAYCRYLDAGWIFASVVLAAIFVDRVDRMAPPARRLVVRTAAALVLALFAIGLVAAWTVLPAVWNIALGRWCLALSIGVAAALFTLFLLAARLRRPAAVLAGLAVLEATASFMIPFASVPRFAGIDRVLIGFLHANAGYQRFAIASGAGLGPNFGSVFRIPAMNYDDLPTPARTARYVTTRLDATNDGVIFGHNAPPASKDARRTELERFMATLPGYAQAGVRYVLSTEDLNADPAYPVAPGPAVPIPLAAGQQAVIDIDGPAVERVVGAVSVLIGTYRGLSDGSLDLELCQGARCASATVPLAVALDNRALLFALQPPVPLAPGAPIRLSVAKKGGTRDVALWMRPAPGAAARLGGLSAPPGNLPIIEWIDDADPRPVLRTATTTIFELSHPRPYASAPGCHVDLRSHDRIEASCPAPSRLLRLEVFDPAWQARVGGADAPIVPVEDTFQSVALPAGDSVVEFTYAPWALRPSFLVALATLALCLAVLGGALSLSRTRRAAPE